MPDFADQLIAELDAAPSWPLPREHEAHEKVKRGLALRKGQAENLRGMHARHGPAWDPDRLYVADPLAKRICQGFADFLFADELSIRLPEPEREKPTPGEPVKAKPIDPAQTELDRVVEINRMPSNLHRAERGVVSEGERYGKWHVNAAIADVPLLTWSSRLNVVPLFYGERLLAAAFVTERCREMGKDDKGVLSSEAEPVVWRHCEIHCTGRVVNVLYCGGPDTLGIRKPLSARKETAGYAEEWRHGLPMLAFRVVNDLDDDDTLGVSDLEDVEGLLLALNRAMTGVVENFDLTGVDRIYTTAKYMGPDGRFDASVQVFQFEAGPEEVLGDGPRQPPIVQAEQRFDAAPAWLHIANLVRTIVRSVGLVPQWVGEQGDGAQTGTESGVHLRLVFMPTTLAANGKIRGWQDVLPEQLHNALKIIALPKGEGEGRGGFGRGKAPAEPPSVEFTDPLPRDTSETTKDVATAVLAEVMSRRTAIREQHPDWTDEQVDEELSEIAEDAGSAPEPPKPHPTITEPDPPEEEDPDGS